LYMMKDSVCIMCIMSNCLVKYFVVTISDAIGRRGKPNSTKDQETIQMFSEKPSRCSGTLCLSGSFQTLIG
jgi:hypothetical protein